MANRQYNRYQFRYLQAELEKNLEVMGNVNEKFGLVQNPG